MATWVLVLFMTGGGVHAGVPLVFDEMRTCIRHGQAVKKHVEGAAFACVPQVFEAL